MSGLTKLRGVIDDLGTTVRGRSSDLEKLTDIIAKVPTLALALTSLKARGTGSQIDPLIPEVLDPDAEVPDLESFGDGKKTAIFDEEDKLEEYVSSQNEKIADILQNPSIGTFLEEYARLYQFIETHRFTSAASQRELLKARADLQFFAQIVKSMGGTSGRTFSFKQFQRDLMDALRNEVKSSVKSAIPSSSKSSGNGGSKDCKCDESLFALQASGVLR